MKITPREVFAASCILLITVNLSIIAHIPIARTICGLLLIGFLPGLFFLYVLDLKDTSALNHVLFAIGLSIVFTLAIGFSVNALVGWAGFASPLAPEPLLFAFTLFCIVLIFVGSFMRQGQTWEIELPTLAIEERLALIPAIVLPAVSVYSIDAMNLYGDGTPLLAFMVMVAAVIALLFFFRTNVPTRIYPLLLFGLSLSVVLPMALRSAHVLGTDAHVEYYSFMMTLTNLRWDLYTQSLLDSCLSITLLPTVATSFLQVDPEILFKLYVSVMYSITPLVVYSLSRQYVDEFYAMVAGLFFMAQPIFLSTAANARTSAAVFFFMFVVLVLFNTRLDGVEKKVLASLFMGGMIMSHYTTTFIVMIILGMVWFFLTVIRLVNTARKVPDRIESAITLDLLLGFGVMIVIWYIFVTQVPMEYVIRFVTKTIESINQFFMPQARAPELQKLFGVNFENKGLPNAIQLVFSWLTFLFIAGGLTSVVVKWIGSLRRRTRDTALWFFRTMPGIDYILLSVVVAIMLVMMITVPFFSIGYDIYRVYPLAITTLSLFFVIGGIFVAHIAFRVVSSIMEVVATRQAAKGLSPRRGRGIPVMSNPRTIRIMSIAILACVIIPHFLASFGFFHKSADIPRDFVLNDEGMQYDLKFIFYSETVAAQWVQHYRDPNLMVFADAGGQSILTSQGLINEDNLTSLIVQESLPEGYVYLRKVNVKDGYLQNRGGRYYNISDYQPILKDQKLLYSNGDTWVMGYRASRNLSI